MEEIKISSWLKDKAIVILVVILIGLIALIGVLVSKTQALKSDNSTEIIKSIAKIKEAKEICSPEQAQLVINDDFLTNKGNYIVIDLSTFKKTTTVRGNKSYDRYQRFGKKEQYYTEVTPIKRELIKVDKSKFVKVESTPLVK